MGEGFLDARLPGVNGALEHLQIAALMLMSPLDLVQAPHRLEDLSFLRFHRRHVVMLPCSEPGLDEIVQQIQHEK